MEDSRTFLNYVHSPGYMFKFDMKSWVSPCKHSRGISNLFSAFSGPLVAPKSPGFFFFLAVPRFDLSSAPYVFTKVFRPLVKHWRFRGIPLVLYIDDGAGCLHDFSVAGQRGRGRLWGEIYLGSYPSFRMVEHCLGSFAWPHIYSPSPHCQVA